MGKPRSDGADPRDGAAYLGLIQLSGGGHHYRTAHVRDIPTPLASRLATPPVLRPNQHPNCPQHCLIGLSAPSRGSLPEREPLVMAHQTLGWLS